MATHIRMTTTEARLVTEAGFSDPLPDGAVVTLQRVVGGETLLQVQLPVDADVDLAADVVELAGPSGHRAAVEAFLHGLDPELVGQAAFSGGASSTPGRRVVDHLLGQAARL